MPDTLHFNTDNGRVAIRIEALIVAGWTGREPASVRHHIAELAALGVAAPSSVPLFYRVSRRLLSQSAQVEMLGNDTSGEAEPMLVRSGGRIWLGLASDHTDRGLETVSVAMSKQACGKVCSASLWALDEVVDHLDRLELRSWINNGTDLYQEGTLAQLLPLPELAETVNLGEGTAMLCGTVPAIGGIRPSADFRAELHDPVLGRTIGLDYQVRVLPIIG